MDAHPEKHLRYKFLAIYVLVFTAVEFTQLKIQKMLNFTASSNLFRLVPPQMFWVFLHCTGPWTTAVSAAGPHATGVGTSTIQF